MKLTLQLGSSSSLTSGPAFRALGQLRLENREARVRATESAPEASSAGQLVGAAKTLREPPGLAGQVPWIRDVRDSSLGHILENAL